MAMCKEVGACPVPAGEDVDWSCLTKWATSGISGKMPSRRGSRTTRSEPARRLQPRRGLLPLHSRRRSWRRRRRAAGGAAGPFRQIHITDGVLTIGTG